MKFTLAAATLASAALVAADQVQIGVQQKGQNIGYLSSKHEGAGFNYFFVGGSGETYNFDPSTNMLTSQQGQYTANFGVFTPFLAIGPAVTPEALKLDNNKITNYNFWACSDVQDPYNYSKSSPVIAVNGRGNDTAPFPNCNKVELVKTSGSSSSSSSSVATSSQWSNVTITSYTTYCPESTVITITSCSNNACNPTALTVTTATTITCTACVVPPITSTTKAPGSTSTTSASTASPAPTITTAVNAAAKNALGAIGAVGIAALML